MDPIKMGVKKGVVVSEHVGYLDVGIRNGLARMFLPPEQAENSGRDLEDLKPNPTGKWHASAGWYHFFHIDDIKQATAVTSAVTSTIAALLQFYRCIGDAQQQP